MNVKFQNVEQRQFLNNLKLFRPYMSQQDTWIIKFSVSLCFRVESTRISISKDTHRACFSKWKTGSSHNWNKHFDNMISVKRRRGEEVEEPWEKVHLENKANLLQLKSPFISCTGARSWTDTQFITLSADLLGLTQIELKYAWHTAVKALFTL